MDNTTEHPLASSDVGGNLRGGPSAVAVAATCLALGLGGAGEQWHEVGVRSPARACIAAHHRRRRGVPMEMALLSIKLETKLSTEFT